MVELIKKLNEKEVLEAILCSLDDSNEIRVPKLDSFLLSEVVNGTIAYYDGDAGKLTEPNFNYPYREMEKQMSNYFNQEMEGKDTPVSNAIKNLVHLEWKYVAFGDNLAERDLYEYFEEIYEYQSEVDITRSTIYLPPSFVKRVREEVIPKFSKKEMEEIVGVAKEIKQYVDKDLKHIDDNFHW